MAPTKSDGVKVPPAPPLPEVKPEATIFASGSSSMKSSGSWPFNACVMPSKPLPSTCGNHTAIAPTRKKPKAGFSHTGRNSSLSNIARAPRMPNTNATEAKAPMTPSPRYGISSQPFCSS